MYEKSTPELRMEGLASTWQQLICPISSTNFLLHDQKIYN
jgi:hypothetical protein